MPSDPAGRSADSDGSSEGVSRIQVSFLRVRFAKVYQEFLQIFAQIPEPAPGIWPFLRHPLPPVVATPTPIPSVRPGHPLPDARNLQRIAPFLVVGTGAAASHADVSGLRTQGILRTRPRSSRGVSRNRPVIPEPDAHTSPPLISEASRLGGSSREQPTPAEPSADPTNWNWMHLDVTEHVFYYWL